MYCISVNHKKTPVHIREHFAFSKEEQMMFEHQMLENHCLKGCVVLSTCNRSEIYFSGEKKSVERMKNALSQFKDISQEEYKEHFNVFCDEDAISHLFKVTAGYESMLIGEDEILGQVKKAYLQALSNGTTNRELNIAFQSAIHTSKQIKTDTAVSRIPISIGTLVSNITDEFLKRNGNGKVLLLGITGSIGSTVAKNLINKGNVNILGFSRKHEIRFQKVNRDIAIEMIPFEERYNYMEEASVIICATSAPNLIISYDNVLKEIENFDKKRLFIDLAVPRNLEKQIGDLKNCELLDMDYFSNVSKQNNIQKLRECQKAEKFLQTKIKETLGNIHRTGDEVSLWKLA